MSKFSLEYDVKRSLALYIKETIGYRVPSEVGSTTTSSTISGYVGDVPYGSIYEVGDVYLNRQASPDPNIVAQVAGDVLYVAQAEPGNPTIVCELAQDTPVRRPKVTVIGDVYRPEVLHGKDDVYVGVRLEQGKSPLSIRTILANVVSSLDRKKILHGEWIFRGNLYLHIEGQHEEAVTQVVEALNTTIVTFQSRLYSLRVRVYGRTVEVRNLEIARRFKNLITADVKAWFTEFTPYGDLPEYLDPSLVTDAQPILGVTPILEEYELEDVPRYAEAGEDVPI